LAAKPAGRYRAGVSNRVPQSPPETHPALTMAPSKDLGAIRATAQDCRACELYARATQTVFGEGSRRADLMLVGEQPGDREDLEGHPFVGPAGRILDEALGMAGIDRERVFVTNVVKHFRWRPSGKRRLHERPGPVHIRACRPWLDLELAAVDPAVVVLLGATAAQALLGRDFRVTERRGELLAPISPGGPKLVATFHPSAILRSRSSEEREAGLRALVEDLRVAAGGQ
jgi:uracil-DNA glycosylase family protein